MFDKNPKARRDLRSGVLYAIAGEADWIYYGQVRSDQKIVFFKRRDHDFAKSEEILSSKIMTIVSVDLSSISRALRSGKWKKLGHFPLHKELEIPHSTVQWPVGTLKVSVWNAEEEISYETRVEDVAIQNMEVAAVWDAEENIPARLTADFGEEEAKWYVGGPIWRQRKVMEEYARRFPDAPWHTLPADWVHTKSS